MKLKTFAFINMDYSIVRWLIVIAIAIVVLMLLNGCTPLREEQRVPVGGALYKATKNADGSFDLEVRVGNDSDHVKGELMIDPVTNKITGFKFEKGGTKGADLAAETTINAMEAQLEQTRLMTPLLQRLLDLIPTTP